ncbi:MAG: hypothetical protein GF308_06945 [Candidatus Heimdallarchaeota archaeon]|nr:hypothetical protein [Candidatus Heimdallarchaeota archaeon]
MIDIILSIILYTLPQSLNVYLISTLSSIVMTMLAFYCLVLFFETFYHPSPFNIITAIFGILTVCVTVGSVIITLVISFTADTLFPGVTTLEDFALPDILTPTALRIAYIFLSILGLGALCVWTLMIYNIIQITRRIRKDKYISLKPQVRQILYWLIIGNVILLIGSFILTFQFVVGEIMIIVGYSIIYLRYLSGGIFVLQTNSLRRLIILDSSGLPIYSHHFLLEQQANIQNVDSQIDGRAQESSSSNGVEDEKDVLFSGALQAVSMLLSELMGT